MLAMPEVLHGVARVFDAMQAKHRAVVEALARAYVPDESDALIEEIENEATTLSILLRNPQSCRISWVTLPEPMAIEETIDAAAALSRAGIHLSDVIVNRMTPAPTRRCGWCDGRRTVERRAVDDLRRRMPFPAAIEVGARLREPRGLSVLTAMGAEIAAARSVRSSSRHVPRARPWRADAVDGGKVTRRIAHRRTRLVFLGGKGGVGKTTCAAAIALVLAAETPARPVLLLSTDPAHSLGDVFGQAIGDDPVRVRDGPRNLRVRAIDAARRFAAIRARYAATVDALFARLMSGSNSGVHVDAGQDRAVLNGLIDLAPPGIDELAAVIDVVDMIDADPSELVVVDTAPTGHALRLLEMPATVHDWTKALMSILLKYQAVGPLEEFGSVLVRLSQGLGRLRRLLADPDRTSFVAVTRAAALPRLETMDLRNRLEQLGIDASMTIVNAVGRGGCDRCLIESADEKRHIAGLKKETPRTVAVVVAPAEMPPPFGHAALGRWQHRWHLSR
jgi:arsenite-transporting ATPase